MGERGEREVTMRQRRSPRLARGETRPTGRGIAAVSDVLVSPDGYRVERILVRRTLDRPAREMLRVRHGTYFVADCTTVAEVAQLVDLASLVPEQRTA